MLQTADTKTSRFISLTHGHNKHSGYCHFNWYRMLDGFPQTWWVNTHEQIYSLLGPNKLYHIPQILLKNGRLHPIWLKAVPQTICTAMVQKGAPPLPQQALSRCCLWGCTSLQYVDALMLMTSRPLPSSVIPPDHPQLCTDKVYDANSCKSNQKAVP